MLLARPLTFCPSIVCRGSLTNSFHTSAGRMEALQNWKRPSIDEMLIPTESHSRVYSANQSKYNMHLLAGVGLFGFTVMVAYNTIETNPTPEFLKKTGFVTQTPEAVLVEAEEVIEEAVTAIDVVEEVEAAAAEAVRIAEQEAAAGETARIASEEAAAAEAARIS